jgi:cytoskeleton protein RodZ
VSIGEALAEAREAAGLTTQQVADATMIRRTLVEAIERDDYRLCGGDVYARGHVKNIAKVIKTDPAPLLEEFDRERNPAPPTASEVFEAETATAKGDRRGPNWTAAMVVALVAVLGLGVYQAVRSGGAPARHTTNVAGGTHSSAGSTPSAPSSQTPAPQATSPSAVAALPQQAAGVSVHLEAVGTSWVTAVQGAQQVFQGTLKAGEVKDFSDPARIRLTVGNAGGVRLVVNGKDLGAPGGSGQVVHLNFAPGDPTAAAAG